MLLAPNQLPDTGKLRLGASRLRAAGSVLGQRGQAIRDFANAIGPGVWTDQSSKRVKSLLAEVADDLATGASALADAATAMDHAVQTVTINQARWHQIEIQSKAARPNIFAPPTPQSVALDRERASIERRVEASMSQAAAAVNHAAGRAPRYQKRARGLDALLQHIGGGLKWLNDRFEDLDRLVGQPYFVT